MSVKISPNLPANVVEIGNEITQAKIDEINAGTLALQTWVSASYAPKASPTFTGTVTIPAGASISGYLTTSTASSTYQTQAGMSSYLTTASASSTYAPKASPTFTGTVTIPAGASISGYATQSYVTSQGYLTDAPSNGNEYVRKNGAWSVATGGGGGGISDAPNDGFSYVRNSAAWLQFTGLTEAPNDGATYVRNMSAWSNITGLGYQTSSDVSTYVTGLGYQTASDVSTYVTGLGYITSTAKSVNTQSGSTYTFASGDANNIVYIPSGSGGGMSMDLYVPDDGTYNFAVGTIINLCYDTSGMTGVNISTTLMGTPTLIGNASLIFGGTQGQRIFTKLASNLWLIS